MICEKCRRAANGRRASFKQCKSLSIGIWLLVRLRSKKTHCRLYFVCSNGFPFCDKSPPGSLASDRVLSITEAEGVDLVLFSGAHTAPAGVIAPGYNGHWNAIKSPLLDRNRARFD